MPRRKVSTFMYSSLACILEIVLALVENPRAGMPRLRMAIMSDVAGHTIVLTVIPLEPSF